MPRTFFKDIDKGFSKHLETWKKSNKGHVKIGVQGKEALAKKKTLAALKLEDEVDLVSVATFNEFGTPDIPERSFLRATIDMNREKINKILSESLLQAQSSKQPLNEILPFLGEWVRAKIQARIKEGISPQNAASTIARKGSSTPLIATGQLRQSITYVVDKSSAKAKK